MRGGNSGAENAIGNLVLHLCGNVRQWIGTGVGELPDVRIREEEFAARGGLTRQDLQRRLTETVEAAAPIFARLTPERLITVVEVQSYRVTVLEAVYHVVEHFSHHTGQIVFATKLLTGADLGFYRHLAQPQHDETTP
jgi:uncharacterized damage-inducible protein DinB